MTRATLIARLDESDRALYSRWVIGASTPLRATRAWTLLTHLGGATVCIAAVLVPALMVDSSPFLRLVAAQAGAALLVSHLIVQLVKRRVLRARPCERISVGTYVAVPDAFSFPSGHSCAVMSVAFVYAVAYPSLAWPLLMLSTLVGISRVRLGVHYPGDVFVGQAIAIATGIVVMALV